MKITETVAIRCHILKLKCTKSDFGWDSDSDPAGMLTALLNPLAGFKEPTFKERGWARQEGKGRERGKGR